jgi:histidinol phosphatase-like PHP family hydrolase
MYDLHVHIIGHHQRKKDYAPVVDSYVFQAELMGLEALGLVDHYPYSIKNVQKIREKITYYKTHADIPIVYGAEIYLPSNIRIPKYFDYSLGHVRRGYSLEEAFKMAQQKNIDIIAHPCAYGARCSNCHIAEYADSTIALEISEKGLSYFPQWLYEKAHELNIPLTLGSDAHDPENMGFSGVLERGLRWTELEKIPFVVKRKWL